MFSMYLDVPGPPEAPEVHDVMHDSCIVSWQPPIQDGGSPVTGYFLERRATSSNIWVKVNKEATAELTLTVANLIESNEYEFRVSAENKAGVGPPSSPSKPIVAKDPCGKIASIIVLSYRAMW